MNAWGTYLLDVALIQLLSLGGYYLLLDREPLGHLKRVYLLLAPAVAFLLPLCTVHYVELPPLPAPTIELPGTPAVVGSMPADAPDYTPLLLLLVYLVGVIWQSARLLRSLLAVRGQVQQAVQRSWHEGACWVTVAGGGPVHTFGRWVFCPVEIPLTGAVQEHELVHVRQWHTLDRLYIALLRVVCWWNPVLWAYERSIIHNHELLADRAARQRTGLSVRAYQQQLLTALRPARVGLSSGLPFYFTKQRIRMLQKASPSAAVAAGKAIVLAGLWTGLLFGFGTTAYGQEPPSTRIDTFPDGPPPPPLPAPPHSGPPPPPPPPMPPSAADAQRLGFDVPDGTTLASMPELDRLRYQLAVHQRLPEVRVTPEQLLAWQHTEVYGVWLDGRQVKNSVLASLRPQDIHHIFRSRLLPNAAHYGQYTHHLEVVTKQAYDVHTNRLEKQIAVLEKE